VKFKVGDFVRVKENTHDKQMPESRHGLIVERHTPRDYVKHTGYTDIWAILMTNGNILRFHEMFLEKVSEEEYEKEDQNKC
jgi:hypothetical protein|tara:strand:+ start:132 stop:374 length:243 start_codon:yes stop_codon:yes gene_type:complete